MEGRSQFTRRATCFEGEGGARLGSGPPEPLPGLTQNLHVSDGDREKQRLGRGKGRAEGEVVPDRADTGRDPHPAMQQSDRQMVNSACAFHRPGRALKPKGPPPAWPRPAGGTGAVSALTLSQTHWGLCCQPKSLRAKARRSTQPRAQKAPPDPAGGQAHGAEGGPGRVLGDAVMPTAWRRALTARTEQLRPSRTACETLACRRGHAPVAPRPCPCASRGFFWATQ